LRHVPEASGTVIAHQWHPSLPRAQTVSFVAKYVERYGMPPRSTAALTYDAVRLVADAYGRASGTTGDAVARALAGTSGFDGVTGRLSFGGTGNPRRSGALSRITPGGNVIVRMMEPAP
jgi:branched-chain amino acid transport system substrate-binding protein